MEALPRRARASVNRLHICRLLTNGVDAPTVMKYSGHKSYPSFSVYLRKTELGEKRACLIVETVDHFLTTSGAPKTNGRRRRPALRCRKSLQIIELHILRG